MFTWSDLPRLDNLGPLITGDLKRDPEDFVVEEMPAYLPSGQGEHLYLWIEKRNVSAEDLLRHVARRLKISRRDIGTAGMKDRRAITRQWVSVPAAAEGRLAKLGSETIRVLESARHTNKLRTAHLAGNRFTIRVRGIAKELRETACEAAERVAASGFPNYFGPQRFGQQGQTARQGLDLLTGTLRPADLPRVRRRFLLRLSISAAQSLVFNTVLAERITADRAATVTTGDILQKTDSGGLFLCESPEADQPRLEAGEVMVTGPLHGPKMQQPEGEPARWEAAALARWELEPKQFVEFSRVAHGTRRRLLVHPGEVVATPATGGIQLTFTLPPGVYATVMLREILGWGD